MKSNFAENKEAKLDRYENLASKNIQLSDSYNKAAHRLGDMIPMGQPIQIGHHSEGMHRRHIAKMDSNMSKCIQADRKASYYANKAESMANNKAIFSDDPEALAKLREKLVDLEKKQELSKNVNKIIKKHGAFSAPVLVEKLGFSLEKAEKMIEVNPRNGKIEGVPGYSITNNGANIRTVKKRIEEEERKSKLETTVSAIGDVIITMNAEDNRTQIKFPDKPNQEIIRELKGSGFRWSHTTGVWQAYLSNLAKCRAERIASMY